MPRDPMVMSLRRQLAAEIVRALGPSAYYRIAECHGFPQPRWSELERGKVERYSMEWLIQHIGRLGGSVQITVTLGDVGREWRQARFEQARADRAAVRRTPGERTPGERTPGEAGKVQSAPRSKSGIRVVL